MDFNNQNGNQGGQFSYDYSGNGTDYSTPTTDFTGDTANWQENSESAQQADQSVYTQSTYTAPDYSADQSPIYNAEPVKNNQGIGLSIASMVCGILGIICCCFIPFLAIVLSIAALVLGSLSIKNKAAGKGMAMAGVICGVIGILLSFVSVILSVMGIALSSSSYY